MDYTLEQKRRFQNRDKRIIVQSTLKAIVGSMGLDPLSEGQADKFLSAAFYITEKIVKKYPTDDEIGFTDDEIGFMERTEDAGEPFPDKPGQWKDPIENPCPKCGNPMKVVPAGISKKTGKPYDAFQTCPVCKPYRK